MDRMTTDLTGILPGSGTLSLRETGAGYVIRSAAGAWPVARECEVAVDVERRVLRVIGKGTADAAGDTILSFDDIDRSEIMRCGLTSCLLLTMRGSGGSVPVAFGKRSILGDVQTRLAGDIRSVAHKVSSYRLGCSTRGRRLKAMARPELS